MQLNLSPVTASLMMAAAVTVAFISVALVSSRFVASTAALNLAMFLSLVLYGMYLAWMSAKPFRAIAPPFLILASVLIVAERPIAFVVPAAAVLSWIRSGICFQGSLWRRTVSEVLTAPLSLALVALLHTGGLTGWAMGVWLFFLIQALYPLALDPGEIRLKSEPASDREAAVRSRAAELLREQKLERIFASLELSSPGDSDK